MSFSEILLVLVVVLLVVKPEDLPEILSNCKKFSLYLQKAKNDIMALFEDEIEDIGEINKYLLKISALDARYDGEYKLPEIKSFYHKLLKARGDEK